MHAYCLQTRSQNPFYDYQLYSNPETGQPNNVQLSRRSSNATSLMTYSTLLHANMYATTYDLQMSYRTVSARGGTQNGIIIAKTELTITHPSHIRIMQSTRNIHILCTIVHNRHIRKAEKRNRDYIQLNKNVAYEMHTYAWCNCDIVERPICGKQHVQVFHFALNAQCAAPEA